MKYLVILGDGMADVPCPALGGQTPLEAADKPHMDALAQNGTVGMARTVPEGMPPGSDAANMAVMGFDPRKYYSGRSPLEAVALGVDLRPRDVTYRTNLVTLSDEPALKDRTMLDYSAGEISNEDSSRLIGALMPMFARHGLELHQGISYRHCAVRRDGETGALLTPPHDISGRCVGDYLPKGRYAEEMTALLEQAGALLSRHPVNQARIAAGKRPANSVWFWGEGTRPRFDSFQSLYRLRGGVVCAVDLIRGLGRCAGMRVVSPPGATGGMVTDYRAKAEAALRLLSEENCDLVYIHIEAPDECGHQGDPKAKVAAIEAIDRDVVSRLANALGSMGEDFRILLTPDHPTPLNIRTHTGDPVPFVIWDSRRPGSPSASRYTEALAQKTGLFLPEGPQLMRLLLDAD